MKKTFEKTILIVDDEESVADSLQMVLKEDYRTLWASDSNEALRLFHRNKIHLILLDVNLPGTDGLGVLRQIRDVEPDLPVIMLTAAQ
ncbi:MAG TPA: response regulator, partial [Nitrospiria bacterium]|nr:response regulator [Nitrospiria bacterium]